MVRVLDFESKGMAFGTGWDHVVFVEKTLYSENHFPASTEHN